MMRSIAGHRARGEAACFAREMLPRLGQVFAAKTPYR